MPHVLPRKARSCAGVITLLLLALSGAAVAAPAPAAAARQLPPQGVYDHCAPETSPDGCASRLSRTARAGFKVVQNMGIQTSAANLPKMLSYATTAHAHGIKVIWNVRPGISDDDLRRVLTALRDHPSTWGYYIYDEPAPADRDTVAAFGAKVKAIEPSHPQLIMGCGNCYGGEGSVSFLSHIDATLGTDIYPVWEQAPDQPIVRKKVAAAAAGLRRVADGAGRQAVMALQAFRWGDSQFDSQATGIGPASRFPTRWEIEEQRNAAIEHGRPDLILWFTLNQVIGWEPGQRLSYWEEPRDPGTRWANLVGGAFAPLPDDGTADNKHPVARFTVRTRPARGTLRVAANGRRSYDPDGRIVRYRWYASGSRRPVCKKRRCALKLRRTRRRALKLVVTDSRGARSSRVRWIARAVGTKKRK